MPNIYTTIDCTALIGGIRCNGIVLSFIRKFELFRIYTVIDSVSSYIYNTTFGEIVIVSIRTASIRITYEFECIMRIFFRYGYKMIELALIVGNRRIYIKGEVNTFEIVVIIYVAGLFLHNLTPRLFCHNRCGSRFLMPPKR